MIEQQQTDPTHARTRPYHAHAHAHARCDSELPYTTIVINLKSRPDRLAHVHRQLALAGMRAMRLEAFYGADAPDDMVAREWDSTLNSAFDKRTLPARLALSDGERGCSASHAAIWRMLAAMPLDAPPVLVLEDDIVLSDGFAQSCANLALAAASRHAPKDRLMLCYLGADVAEWRDGATELRTAAVVDGEVVTLCEAEYLWQTSSYLIWPAAARFLVGDMPIDAPVDCFLSRHVLQGRLTALVARPQLAWQARPYQDGDVLHTNLFKSRVQL